MLRENGKFTYGFWVIVVCFLFQFCVVTLQYHVPGQFVAPMAEELGFSRSSITSALSLTTVSSMVSMLFAGFIFKKYNLRLIVCVCTTVYGILYFVQSYCHSMTEIYVISVIRGLLVPFSSMFPLTLVMNNWFGRRMIGKVVSYVMIGNSVGLMVMTPIIGYLIKNAGWRACFRVITFWPILVVPFVAFILVDKPEKKGMKRIGDIEGADLLPAGQTDGVTMRQALKTGAFWFALFSLMIWSGTTQTWNFMGPSFLADAGRDPVMVAAVLSVSAFGNLVGKIILGPYYDKNIRNGLSAGYATGILAFVAAIFSVRWPFLAYVASFLFGFTIATVGATASLVTGALFGRRDYGVINSFMNIGGSTGSSAMPLVMTYVYTLVQSYTTIWGVMTALSVVTILLLFCAFSGKARKKMM